MPPINSGRENTTAPKTKVRVKPKPKPPTRAVVVPSGDQVDRNRAVRTQQLQRSVPKTPDQADRKRTPPQQQRDQQVVAKNVRDSRVKVVTERNAGSGSRALAKLLHDTVSTATGGANSDAPSRRGRAEGGTGFAAVDAQRGGKRVPVAFGLGSNAIADAGELAVTTPTSIAKLVETAATDPKKVPGMLAAPYIELAKHPVRELTERPVSTALMIQPTLRMPGRAAGRVARIAGKQTLERPAAALPGTSLKQKRTGSRDIVVRAKQARDDRKNPAPTVSAQELRRRVDEHFDAARQRESHAETAADKAARKATKGQPKDQRAQAREEARNAAREQARRESEEQFAREFGANARLSAGADARNAAKDAREQVQVRLKDDKKAAAAADRRVSTARKRVRRARREHTDALAAAREARVNVGARRGVPQAEADRLLRAIHERDAATAELAAARAGRPVARAQVQTTRVEFRDARATHIDAKRAMGNATLTDAAPEGRVFDHKADAAKVAQRLNEQSIAIPSGSHTPVRYGLHEDGKVKLERTKGGPTEQLEFTIREVGEKWTVVPRIANDQIRKHQVVGSSPATPAKVMKRARGQFTQAVLPLSLKWLAGQGIEAGVRSVVAGAGPLDLLRTGRVVKQLNKERAGAGDELLDRITGGQFELTGAARDFARGKSLADEFQDSKLGQPAAALTHAGSTAPMRAVRQGWRVYTDSVVGLVNRVFEHTARRAMAGQALKNSEFMERRINGLSDRAIADAAHGLRGTEAQVELARTVDRMYGQYQKFSPERRSLLLHWTPFLPWYLNVVTFLGKVLPIDHPIQAALIADASTATEEWRKDAGLSLRYGGNVPDFLLGRYPGKGGKLLPVAKYTPWGIGADVGGSVAGLMLPQFTGPVKNLAGVDWKWQRLKRPGYGGAEFTLPERAARAAVSAGESMVPGVNVAGRLTGLTPRYIDKKDEIAPLRERLAKELPWWADPDTAIAPPGKKAAGPKVKPIRVKPVRVKPVKVKPIRVR